MLLGSKPTVTYDSHGEHGYEPRSPTSNYIPDHKTRLPTSKLLRLRAAIPDLGAGLSRHKDETRRAVERAFLHVEGGPPCEPTDLRYTQDLAHSRSCMRCGGDKALKGEE